MILQVALVAIVTRAAIAWPITPLDGYSRTDTEEILLRCGFDEEHREPISTNLYLTFADHDEYGNIPANCSIKLRIAVEDIGLKKFGIRVSGSVDVTDNNRVEMCKYSYMSVADEDSLDDELGKKEKFCDKENITFTTTEDIVVIELVVGGSGASGGGFQLMVEPHYLCGGEVELEETITSPDYPASYPRDINCIWRVQAPDGHDIVVKCKDFELKPPRRGRCTDYLMIMGVGIYCGRQLEELKQVKVEGNTALVDFRSNKLQNKFPGFSCKLKFVRKTKDLLMAKFFK